MCKEKNMEKNNILLASLKSLKKGVGSGVGSGSISQRYESVNPRIRIPIPHQNVTDPQHCHGVQEVMAEALKSWGVVVEGLGIRRGSQRVLRVQH
jgi:hypothetical protein